MEQKILTQTNLEFFKIFDDTKELTTKGQIPNNYYLIWRDDDFLTFTIKNYKDGIYAVFENFAIKLDNPNYALKDITKFNSKIIKLLEEKKPTKLYQLEKQLRKYLYFEYPFQDYCIKRFPKTLQLSFYYEEAIFIYEIDIDFTKLVKLQLTHRCNYTMEELLPTKLIDEIKILEKKLDDILQTIKP